ncbi:hypothetical protein C8250_028860 [Streptomyces sp. So13.3]|uniref:replication-relaxation family protein n=1 Tax=Streptomyces sp. So13.3 TaxID=2136173 RepID=UPI0011071698|nr:replication-relaxation family protein [Streptomyces sp. So13.3]QNA75364.1 hypothetical protein C8250_028860 [Streptomyces sp. So13.3]
MTFTSFLFHFSHTPKHLEKSTITHASYDPKYAIYPPYLRQAATTITVLEETVLRTLASIRVATAEQVARTVFGGNEPAKARQLAHRHLRRLTKRGLIRRLPNAVASGRPGPRRSIYVLTTGGARLAAAVPEIVKPQRKTWRPGASKLAHWLAIGDLYVRLVEDERHGGPKVIEFLAEAAAKRTFLDSAGRRRLLRPDAVVRLFFGGMELHWFIEIDRNTEGLGAIDQKCRTYRDYELSDFEYARYGINPAVLFIAPDQHRTDNIARVIASQPADTQGLYLATTEADALKTLRNPEFP